MTFQNSILAGNVLVREAIQSHNFQPGVAGWRIQATGDAEFNEVAVRGQVHAGTDTDYVEIGANPVPQVTFGTSSPDVTAPATIGYADIGVQQFRVVGPAQFGTNGELSFTFSTTILAAGDNMTLTAPTFLNLASPFIEIGNSSGSVLAVDAAARAYRFAGVDQGRGLLDFTVLPTSAPAVTTTETVGITSDTVGFEDGRAYRVTVRAWVQSTVAGDIVTTRLRKTNASGQQYFDTFRSAVVSAAGSQASISYQAIIRNVSGATVTAPLVVTYLRISGTGNVFLGSNAVNPSWIQIEDIGAAADYAGANNIT